MITFLLINSIMITELQKDITRRAIKIIDIGYSSGFYLLSAILCVTIINKVIGKYNNEKEEKKSTGRLILDVLLI